jgi:hypothetical protein
LPLGTTWIALEDIKFEISQPQRKEYCLNLLICGIKTESVKHTKIGNKIVVTRN